MVLNGDRQNDEGGVQDDSGGSLGARSLDGSCGSRQCNLRLLRRRWKGLGRRRVRHGVLREAGRREQSKSEGEKYDFTWTIKGHEAKLSKIR